MSHLIQDQLEDEIFLAMLERSRASADNFFDLERLCVMHGLPATSSQLISFARDNDGKFGTSNHTMKRLGFNISAEGLRHAVEIENSRRKPTIKERLSSVPIGKGVWDLIKIGLGFAAGILTHKFTGS